METMSKASINTLNDQYQQFEQIKDKLIRENEDLSNQIEAEKKNLAMVEQYVKETSQKIAHINEEKNSTDIQLKLEELKLKACSDETIKFIDILIKEIEYETEIYKKKNQQYLEEHNIDITLERESKTVKINFLNNDQEIVIKMDQINKKFNVSYQKLSDELNESGKKDEMLKILKQFNDGSSSIKQMVLNLRDLFYN